MPAEQAATPTRIRTLTYRRAVWSGSAPWSLREFVRLISELPHTEARTFPYKGEFLTGVAWKNETGKTYGHIVQWAKDRATSTVEDPSPVLLETHTAEFPPPEGKQYVGGDITFLATGNHLLLCPSGAREAVVNYYLQAAADQLGFGIQYGRCNLEPVADIDKVGLIQREGVKSIRLDSSLYEATMLYEEEQREKESPRTVIFRNLGKALKDLLATDLGLPDITDKENVNVKLEISYDSRKKGGGLGRQRMEELAREVVEEEEDDGGFRIVTNEGKMIRGDSLNIKYTLPVEASGNTVYRGAAWRALSDFYDRLRQSGALET